LSLFADPFILKLNKFFAMEFLPESIKIAFGNLIEKVQDIAITKYDFGTHQ